MINFLQKLCQKGEIFSQSVIICTDIILILVDMKKIDWQVSYTHCLSPNQEHFCDVNIQILHTQETFISKGDLPLHLSTNKKRKHIEVW